ncbi:hypothetical protein C7E19_01870 [Stenotrophomonas maltophilia]|nr:hypothetical protein C7E19_01870 [Stenotrophomonas maltophilia]
MLAGCGETKQPLTRTELVEWPVLVYVELPPALTDPLQAPAPPQPLCRLQDGTLTPCAIDAIVREAAWQQLLQRVNDDRATSGRLSGARKNVTTQSQWRRRHEMKISLELWQALSLVLALLGTLVGLVKWGISQIKASIDQRMAGFEKAAEGWRKQELDLLGLRAELAREYVRRDDHIRSQTVIEAKLDAINSEIKSIQIQGARREH